MSGFRCASVRLRNVEKIHAVVKFSFLWVLRWKVELVEIFLEHFEDQLESVKKVIRLNHLQDEGSVWSDAQELADPRPVRAIFFDNVDKIRANVERPRSTFPKLLFLCEVQTCFTECVGCIFKLLVLKIPYKIVPENLLLVVWKVQKNIFIIYPRRDAQRWTQYLNLRELSCLYFAERFSF